MPSSPPGTPGVVGIRLRPGDCGGGLLLTTGSGDLPAEVTPAFCGLGAGRSRQAEGEGSFIL